MKSSAVSTVQFKGIAISKGTVYAPLFVVGDDPFDDVPEYSLQDDDDVQTHLQAYRNALNECQADLRKATQRVEKTVGKAESQIFLAHEQILLDTTIQENIQTIIRDERKNVEYAVDKEYKRFIQRFKSLDDTYFRERADDINDIRKRLLAAFDYFKENHTRINPSDVQNHIIVAHELMPSLLASFDYTDIAGIITEKGGRTSHAAIVARGLGIPAVSGIHGMIDVAYHGDSVLVDGNEGKVYLKPDDELLETVHPAAPESFSSRCCRIAIDAETPAGMAVMANASSLRDVDMALRFKADGIGLYRTELEFIQARRLLSAEEQYEVYRSVMEKMAPRPVTFRLLDFGGDKPLAALEMEKEFNPFLGWRGARVLLDRPDVFSSQMSALGRLSREYPVRVMFPMIIDIKQLDRLLALTKEVLNGTPHTAEHLHFGVMFEVPSAYFQARDILRRVDFGSIGTNDLIQYLFAVDRNNEHVSDDYDPDHPVIWEVMGNLSRIANELDKPLSICGELAGMENMVPRLATANITRISVTPTIILTVKHQLADWVKQQPPEQT